jgi:hypothetical protein
MKTNKKELALKDHYYKIIPLALILLVVPCIVYLKYTLLKEGVALDFSLTGEKYYDFFAYYKSVWLIVITLLSVATCIFYMRIKDVKLTLPKILIPLIVYFVFVLISSALSKYHDQAFWGFNDRFEGFFVITCYVLICLMSATFVTYEMDIKILFGALIICGSILGILGITQFWGFDFLQSEFGRHLILPKSNYDLGLDFNFANQYIYSTLYNPNYVGGFFTMLLPIGITFAIFSKKVLHRIIFCVFSCVSFINLIGCLSKTGYVAGAISVIFLVLLMNKHFLKAWRTVLILFVSFTVLLFWMNNISNGTIIPGLKLVSSKTSQAQTTPAYSEQEVIAKVSSQIVLEKPLQLDTSKSQVLKPQTLQLEKAHVLKAQAGEQQTPQPLPIENLQLQVSQPKPVQLQTSITQQDASLGAAPSWYITDFNIDKNTLTLYLGSSVANITFNASDSTCSFKDNSGKDLEIVKDTEDTTIIKFVDPRFVSLAIKFDGNYLNIKAANISFNVYISPEEKVFKFVNHRGKPVDIETPESIGFNGYERWASSRGYIWSRSLPLLKDTLFIGHGPDTFALYFPQNDFVNKLKYLDTPYTLVDKPHNMYLQIALNTGVLSLVAFIVFVLWFVISAIKLYIKPKSINTFYIAGVSCVTAVVGYLVAGLANDSIIGVSTVFWVLLGIGIACNRLYSKSIAVNPIQQQQPLKGKKVKR